MNKPKILIDLKPALDGFAGIPQESRLLFRDTLKLNEYIESHGLLQHGGASLKYQKRSNAASEAVNTIIDYSNTVVSFDDADETRISKYLKRLIQPIALVKKTLQAFFKIPEPLGQFESALFEDFIWTRLFSKSLKSRDKQLVTKAQFRILEPSRNLLNKIGLYAHKYLRQATYLTLDTKGYAYLIAQTPFPGRVSKETQLIIRYHDAVPVLLPQTIGDRAAHQATHYLALKDNVASGAHFCCISESTRADLLKIFPEVAPRTSVIYNSISDDYFQEQSSPEIINQILTAQQHKNLDHSPQARHDNNNSNSMPQYLLMVATLEPRKNHLLLLTAWERLRHSQHANLKLVIVGSKGWEYQPILTAFKPWIAQGALIYLNNLPAHKLRALYNHAAATVCPSLAEGFDYSGVEAMRCGCPVIASDIPVHREIYAEGSAYFDPYCAEDASNKMLAVIQPEEGKSLRKKLKDHACDIIKRYTTEALMPEWQALLSNPQTATTPSQELSAKGAH